MAQRHTVRFEPVDIEIEVSEDETILDAGFRQGIMLAHGCKEGQCSACKSFLLSGDVQLERYSTFALADYEQEEGYTLLFNGKDLQGWEIVNGGKWSVEDGAIVMRRLPGETNGAWLFTTSDYSDFMLRTAAGTAKSACACRPVPKSNSEKLKLRGSNERLNYPSSS